MATGILKTLGWREWVGLPGLEIDAIKAKIDTGARTSALHAFAVKNFRENGIHRVQFKLHPFQRNIDTVRSCIADVVDRRVVTDSGGHREERWVIRTEMSLGTEHWPIELTLTDRDNMNFRMLLGRTAMNGKAVVDPSRSYIVGRKPTV